jgi:MarR family transcriptional regulator, organic hydroperoxide resistance regulator
MNVASVTVNATAQGLCFDFHWGREERSAGISLLISYQETDMVTKTLDETEESRRHVTKLVKRIFIEFRTLMDKKLRPYGATIAQVRLLLAIRSAPGSSGAQLARQCEVTPQSAQALIEKAEESGWIIRGKDSRNERIVTASLTPAGEKLLKVADRSIRKLEAKAWKDVSPRTLGNLIELFEQCLENLGSKERRKYSLFPTGHSLHLRGRRR